MKNWWSKLSLTNKLQIPIQLTLFVIIATAVHAVRDKFEERVLEESRQKAAVSVDGVLNGLNMLMINDIISKADQRTLFVKKMGSSEKVLELRVIRGKSIKDEFGQGLPSEQPGDEMDREALESAKEQSKLLDQNGVQSLRVVVPYIAEKEFRDTKLHEVSQRNGRHSDWCGKHYAGRFRRIWRGASRQYCFMGCAGGHADFLVFCDWLANQFCHSPPAGGGEVGRRGGQRRPYLHHRSKIQG